MKKSLILIGLSVALFSCKKTPTAPTLTANGIDGVTVFTGHVTKDQNFTNNAAPFQGVTVTVTIPNSELYPYSGGSNTYGNSIFSGVTDANGNFSINVTSTTQGINAWVKVTGIVSTYDAVNGDQYLYGNWANRMWFRAGTPTSVQTIDLGTTGDVIGTSVTGTATVTGILFISDVNASGGYLSVPMPSQALSMNFNADPTTGNIKNYTTTTDAKGNYTFTVTTTNASGYADLGVIVLPDYAHTQDTVTNAGVFQSTGLPGVYRGYKQFIGGLTPNVISNENYLYYGINSSSFNAN